VLYVVVKFIGMEIMPSLLSRVGLMLQGIISWLSDFMDGRVHVLVKTFL